MLQQCYMELLKQKEGGNRMNHYEAINDVLVNLFNEILDLEERALITGEYKNISVNDMHIINAVGIREQKNMSTVARELNVTVGTLTIAVNNLVKKGYIQRMRSQEDRREGSSIGSVSLVLIEDDHTDHHSHQQADHTESVFLSCHIIAQKQQIAQNKGRMIVHDHIVSRGMFNVVGCLLFIVLYLILPKSMYPYIGMIGGIGVGYSAGYPWQTAFNTFGALSIAAGIFGMPAAIALRIGANVLGAAYTVICNKVTDKVAEYIGTNKCAENLS